MSTFRLYTNIIFLLPCCSPSLSCLFHFVFQKKVFLQYGCKHLILWQILLQRLNEEDLMKIKWKWNESNLCHFIDLNSNIFKKVAFKWSKSKFKTNKIVKSNIVPIKNSRLSWSFLCELWIFANNVFQTPLLPEDLF